MFIFTIRPQYIHTRRITVIVIAEKPKYPLLEPHAGIKMVQVLGSPVYPCGLALFLQVTVDDAQSQLLEVGKPYSTSASSIHYPIRLVEKTVTQMGPVVTNAKAEVYNTLTGEKTVLPVHVNLVPIKEQPQSKFVVCCKSHNFWWCIRWQKVLDLKLSSLKEGVLYFKLDSEMKERRYSTRSVTLKHTQHKLSLAWQIIHRKHQRMYCHGNQTHNW